MTKDGCTDKLQEHFGKAGIALIDSIHKWMSIEQFTSDEIDDIYDAIIDNHDQYFPSLKKIKTYYYKHSSRRGGSYITTDTILNRVQGWDLGRILRVYKWLMFQKQERNAFENYYITVFQPLFYKHSVCVEKYGDEKGNEIAQEMLDKIRRKSEIEKDYYSQIDQKFLRNLDKRKRKEVGIKEVFEELF